jgi:indole-3-glycerol phosphate synthase
LKTLKELARDAAETVASGYYAKVPKAEGNDRSLVKSILSKGGRAIVCEIKFASPSAGKIDGRYDQVATIARQMELGGAAGLSVLTEPKSFNGSLKNLLTARKSTHLPIIMKDIIVSQDQILAARHVGASAILLIWELFAENYADKLSLLDAIKTAKDADLEVIVETHSAEGLSEAVKLPNCDIIGINNRDLKTFRTSIETTVELLAGTKKLDGRLIMSESGYDTEADIAYILKKLKSLGASLPSAFLIGTSIMKVADVETKVREFSAQVEVRN